jgi:aryl carrier-like protein
MDRDPVLFIKKGNRPSIWHWQLGTGNFFFMYFCLTLLHCFTATASPPPSTVSEDAEIEPRTIATSALALAVRRSNHSARSHPQSADLIDTRLNLIHAGLDLIHAGLDLIHARLDLIHAGLDLIHARLNLIHTRLDLIHARLDLIHAGLDFIYTRLELIYTRVDLIHARLDLIHDSATWYEYKQRCGSASR